MKEIKCVWCKAPMKPSRYTVAGKTFPSVECPKCGEHLLDQENGIKAMELMCQD